MADEQLDVGDFIPRRVVFPMLPNWSLDCRIVDFRCMESATIYIQTSESIPIVHLLIVSK